MTTPKRPPASATPRAGFGDPFATDDGGHLDEGVVASDAWARSVGPLPTVPTPPQWPGRPNIEVSEPPPEVGLRVESLRGLAYDAASRATELAFGELETGLDLSVDEDLARWAAVLFETGSSDTESGPNLADLARRTGMALRELERRAMAWRDGGVGGFATLVDSWDPYPSELEPGRERLGPSTITRRNRLTHHDEQLRLGRDGRWYPYRKTRNGWDPDGPPFEENELAR